VLDSNSLRELRRSHGLEANPFAIHPRAVISLPWLRTPRVQRLLDEVLTPQTRHPGFFDLLIVDEAHHCAPPAPQRRRGYAVDSKQTRAVRRLGRARPAPAVPVRDAAQRLQRVVAGAAADARPAPLRPRNPTRRSSVR